MAGRDSSDRIAELLKEACPPASASPEFKAGLRYRLNEQAAAMGASGPKPLWQRPLLWIPATALVTAAVVLIVYFVFLHSVPLSVTTRDATAVQTNAAILRGNLESLGTADNVQVSFEWGSGEDYGNETVPEVRESSGDFTANLSGLAPNTKYYYRVKVVTPHGIVYGRPMEFVTGPVPPVVATTGAIKVKATSATLRGTVDDLGSAGSVSVSFEWGSTTDYGNDTPAELMTETGKYSADLSGLSPDTTYHFRAKAVGDATTFGADVEFTTKTEPPSVVTGDATAVATNAATLNGDLASLGTASSVGVSFEYGTGSGSYALTTAEQVATTAGAFSADLSGLAPGTVYYYRARAIGEGDPAFGEERSLTTSISQPTLATHDATNVAGTSATLNGDLISLGSAASVAVSFEYGTTLGGPYTALAVGDMDTTGSFSIGVDGMTSGTSYYFRAVADGDGDPVYGAERSFTTKLRPSVVTKSASNVDSDSATLNGELTSLGTAAGVTVSFVWGTAEGGPYSDQTVVGVMDSAGPFQVDLAGLAPGTTYYFRATARGDGDVYGDEVMFVTARVPPAQKTWYLSSEPADSVLAMWDGDTTKPIGTVPIRSAPGSPDSAVWVTGGSLAAEVFPRGEWAVHLALSHLTGEHEITVEIGTWRDSSFSSQGSHTFIASGTNDRDLYRFDFAVAVSSFTVPPDGFVAMRVTVTDRCHLWVDVHVGGSQSYVTSPAYEEPVATGAAMTATTPEPAAVALANSLDVTRVCEATREF